MLNRHWYDQQAVIVGAGVKVVQPVRHLVGNDGSHRGIELVAMGLPEVHRFQVTTNDKGSQVVHSSYVAVPEQQTPSGYIVSCLDPDMVNMGCFGYNI